jgi:acylphosphatase
VKKQYTLTLKGKVQQVGFRGYAEDVCRQLTIGGMIYNLGDDEVKILCEAEETAVNKLYQSLKEYRLAEITEAKIEEGIQLPSSLHRGVIGLEQELYSRVDSGIKILENVDQTLSNIKQDTSGIAGIRQDTSEIKQGIAGIRQDTEGTKQNTKDIKSILERIEKKI